MDVKLIPETGGDGVMTHSDAAQFTAPDNVYRVSGRSIDVRERLEDAERRLSELRRLVAELIFAAAKVGCRMRSIVDCDSILDRPSSARLEVEALEAAIRKLEEHDR